MVQDSLPAGALGPGQIALRLHRFTDFSKQRIAALHSLLSPRELARNNSFRHADHRDRDSICRGLLREYLAHFLTVTNTAIELTANDNGKPVLLDNPTGLQFNYSHSGEYVVFAFCYGSEIGVDIEQTQRRNNALGIAQHFFADAEVEALQALPESSQRQHFFRYWTLKEAYLKARGEGIFIGLDKFSFTLHPTDESDIAIAFCNPEFDTPQHWQFHSLQPAAGYRVSVAVRHAPPHFPLSLYS